MKKQMLVPVVALLAGICLSLSSVQATAAPEKKVRVLYLTQSSGYTHGVVKRARGELALSEKAFTELADSSGAFTIDCTQDAAKAITKENLANYDVVMFYTSGNLPIAKENLDYFLGDWLKQKGHGFVGIHAATDCLKNHQPYWDMIGGTFIGHPWGSGSTVTITVHEKDHPGSAPWGEEVTLQDEIYRFKNWQPEKVRVLMSLNMAKTAKKEPYHVPIAWCKEYGQGKVFYMSLGHRNDIFTNEQYLASMLGAIRWAAGLEEGDATPNPGLSAEEEQKAKAAAGK